MLLFFESHRIQKAKIYSKDDYQKAQGYSALSSTYYTIAGAAISALKVAWAKKHILTTIAWFFTWLPLGGWCYVRMFRLSGLCLKYAGSYKNMSVTQCDIRQSILRKSFWIFKDKNYNEAQKCILEALKKNPPIATKALLHIGLANIDIHERCYDTARIGLDTVLSFVKLVEDEDEYQAIRVYKGCGALAGVVRKNEPELAKDLFHCAKLLALKHRAKDQLQKIKAMQTA